MEHRYLVTPFVGVWIETHRAHDGRTVRCHTLRGCVDWNTITITCLNQLFCHTLRGCVDWNAELAEVLIRLMSHTLRGCVDWNYTDVPYESTSAGHTLRGCVDWNFENIDIKRIGEVTPFVGVWIETLQGASQLVSLEVTPFVGVWIETREMLCRDSSFKSHPSWVCGLKQLPVHLIYMSFSHTLRGCVDWTWLPACYTLSK